MNRLERVKNAIHYQTVDRVPAGLFGTDRNYLDGLRAYMGKNSIEAMFEALGVDVWHAGCGLRYTGGLKLYKGRLIDPCEALYSERNPFPPFAEIRSAEEVWEYPFPVKEELDVTELSKEVEAHKEFAICPGINAAIFHNYLYMCEQINGMCLLKSDPAIAHAIIGRITDYWVDYLKVVLDACGNNSVFMEACNDFGTQRSLFISPEDFRTFFKPQLQRLYHTAHGYDVGVMQHSCGAVCPIIPDFIEIGADILNPIQVSADAMALDGIVKAFYGKIAFYGGLDTQYLLPQGPPEKIRHTVANALSLFGKQGGFILSGSQGLMHDIPYAHAAALLDPALRR